jgi:hypothetical protein
LGRIWGEAAETGRHGLQSREHCGTVIGGILAIIGGLLAAWRQSKRTEDVALTPRRLEREEEGLLQMAPLVGEIFIASECGQGPERESPGSPATQQQPAQEAAEFAGRLRIEWDREASWRVHRPEVRSSVTPLVEALDACPSGGYASTDEIVDVHNRSNGLARAIQRALEGRADA